MGKTIAIILTLCFLVAAAALPALKFQDEFDGVALNFAKWSPHAPARVDLGGVQAWAPDAITVSGGEAHITARRTGEGVTSGVLTTFGNFAQTYGRFEIRCRAPKARGVESVVRLLPIPGGELPSFEVMKISSGELGFITRWGDRDYSTSLKIADGFHTIAAEWDDEKIVWSVDGIEKFHSFDGVPHQPMYVTAMVLVNTPDAALPATLDIDYVRVLSAP